MKHLDVLVITEAKLDDAFLNGRLCRNIQIRLK